MRSTATRRRRRRTTRLYRRLPKRSVGAAVARFHRARQFALRRRDTGARFTRSNGSEIGGALDRCRFPGHVNGIAHRPRLGHALHRGIGCYFRHRRNSFRRFRLGLVSPLFLHELCRAGRVEPVRHDAVVHPKVLKLFLDLGQPLERRVVERRRVPGRLPCGLVEGAELKLHLGVLELVPRSLWSPLRAKEPLSDGIGPSPSQLPRKLVRTTVRVTTRSVERQPQLAFLRLHGRIVHEVRAEHLPRSGERRPHRLPLGVNGARLQQLFHALQCV